MNKIILMGNMTRAVELRYTSGATAMAVGSFGMAYNKKRKDKEDKVLYVDVTVWGKTAEIVAQYTSKGSRVLIEGELELDQWKDKLSGENRQKISINAQQVIFLDSKPQEGQRAQQQQEMDHQHNQPTTSSITGPAF